MAIRGKRPVPSYLRVITGNPGGHNTIPIDEPQPEGAVERPAKLSKKVGAIWDRWISRCDWLTWADSPKALMWCHLQAEFERSPTKMIASRLAQLRALGCELGLDPVSRRRMGGKPNAQKKDPASKYLGPTKGT
jgi:hypothetical protein